MLHLHVFPRPLPAKLRADMFSWVLSKNWLAGFLLATHTGGEDLIVTGFQWRRFQKGKRPEILHILLNTVSTRPPVFGP